MIHSISKGQGFGGSVRYVRNKPGAEIIGGSFEPTASASEISAHLGRPAHEADLTSKPVFHASLSLRPGEVLTDQQWRQAARTYLDALGFTDCPYLLVRHTDRKHDHVHIVTSRVTSEGTLVSDSNDYKKGMEVLRRIEKRFQLEPPLRVHHDQDKTPSRAEYQRDRRTGENNVRKQLQTLVHNAASDKPDLSTFVRRLHTSGVEVRFKTSGDNIRGISFDYRSQSFRGSSLGRSYSWSALQKNHGLTFDPARDQHLLKSKPLALSAWSPELSAQLGDRLASLRPASGRSVIAEASARLRSDGSAALQAAASATRIVSVVRNPGRALLRQLPGGSALLSGLSLYGAFTNPQVGFAMAAGLAVQALAARGQRSLGKSEGDGRAVLRQFVSVALADHPTPETFLARLSEAGIGLRTNARGTLCYSAAGLELPATTLGATSLPENLEKTLGRPLDGRSSSPALGAFPEASKEARSAIEQHLSALNAPQVDIRIGTGSGSQLLSGLSPSQVVERLAELADSQRRGLAIAVRPSSGVGAHFVGWTSPDQLGRAAAAGFQPAAVVQDGSKLAVWVQHAPAAAEVRPFLDRAVQLAYAQPDTRTARAFGPLAGIGPAENLVSAPGVCYGRAHTLAAELTAARAERTAALAARLASVAVPRLQTYSAAVGGSSKAVDLAWTRLAVSRGLEHGDILAVLAQHGAHRLSSPIHQLSYASRTLGAALGQHPTSPALLRSAAVAVAMPVRLVMAAYKIVRLGVSLTR